MIMVINNKEYVFELCDDTWICGNKKLVKFVKSSLKELNNNIFNHSKQDYMVLACSSKVFPYKDKRVDYCIEVYMTKKGVCISKMLFKEFKDKKGGVK